MDRIPLLHCSNLFAPEVQHKRERIYSWDVNPRLAIVYWMLWEKCFIEYRKKNSKFIQADIHRWSPVFIPIGTSCSFTSFSPHLDTGHSPRDMHGCEYISNHWAQYLHTRRDTARKENYETLRAGTSLIPLRCSPPSLPLTGDSHS